MAHTNGKNGAKNGAAHSDSSDEREHATCLDADTFDKLHARLEAKDGEDPSKLIAFFAKSDTVRR